jgi:hypothetical protein
MTHGAFIDAAVGWSFSVGYAQLSLKTNSLNSLTSEPSLNFDFSLELNSS